MTQRLKDHLRCHAALLPLVTWADIASTTALCTVMGRAGYEIAVETDQDQAWVRIEAKSAILLRVGVTALLATDIVDSRLYRERLAAPEVAS